MEFAFFPYSKKVKSRKKGTVHLYQLISHFYYIYLLRIIIIPLFFEEVNIFQKIMHKRTYKSKMGRESISIKVDILSELLVFPNNNFLFCK